MSLRTVFSGDCSLSSLTAFKYCLCGCCRASVFTHLDSENSLLSCVPACYIAMCAVCYSASATLAGVRMNSGHLLHLLTSDLLREDHLMGVEGILVVVRELPKHSMQQWLGSAALLWGWGGSLLLPRECPAPALLTVLNKHVSRGGGREVVSVLTYAEELVISLGS